MDDRILSVLDKLGFTTPTPIQEKAIPLVLSGRDVVGLAQTGTGKTFAFGLPTVQLLKEGEQALILAPTRELALQISNELDKIGRPLGIKQAVLIGGAPMNRQVGQLRARPNVIVATPGRLEDHLNQRTFKLDRVTKAILDEADRMLDMGFAPAIRRIFSALRKDRQTMLFSATFPEAIEELAASLLDRPARVEIAQHGTTAELVSQSLMVVSHDEKPEVLKKLLAENPGTILVFTRTRHGARKTAKLIRAFGHDAAELHSDRTLAQRRDALEGFKAGKYRVLVATDIASRGIDVKAISLVINYDLPDQPEDYVHRIGRTGRAGEAGLAITIATPEQTRELRAIERVLKEEIPLSPDSPLRVERGHRTAHQQRPPFQHARKPRRHGPGFNQNGGRRHGPSASTRARG